MHTDMRLKLKEAQGIKYSLRLFDTGTSHVMRLKSKVVEGIK